MDGLSHDRHFSMDKALPKTPAAEETANPLHTPEALRPSSFGPESPMPDFEDAMEDISLVEEKAGEVVTPPTPLEEGEEAGRQTLKLETASSALPAAESDIRSQVAALLLNTQALKAAIASPTSSTHEPESVLERTRSPVAIAQSPEEHQAVDLPPAVSPTTPMNPHFNLARASTRDSTASSALSESSLDYDHLSTAALEAAQATPRVSSLTNRHTRKPSSLDILANSWNQQPPIRQSTLFDAGKDSALSPDTNPWTEREAHTDFAASPSADDDASIVGYRSTSGTSASSLRPRSSSSGSSSLELVDWENLDQTEQAEKAHNQVPEGSGEEESTAFLLARLEQENEKFSTAPTPSKGLTRVRNRGQSRPLSIQHLARLVATAPATSATPLSPPPMTELEFWAALVQDYPSTAARLPTLTTTKIRSGIPAPLRGVVWSSVSGAVRDPSLLTSFDSLVDQRSPYEGIINKDVGRSFPGVDLFRDALGPGQTMLSRVLRCYSLYDSEIGYCQGLGFLVGPLLMNMGEREAFAVLVRLMQNYSLRPSFLPSLEGLHSRIYQFSALLKLHLPELSAHFETLGVEPAYLSQWFLSCFAVTCPLELLFRIYDVVFAEGANETVMRVALALMSRNAVTMMAMREFEEVMQLLLGRGVWDDYAGDADALVEDFTGLGDVVTHARLAELEAEFDKVAKKKDAGVGWEGVQSAAGRFLGRLGWTPSHGSAKSMGGLAVVAEKEATGRSLLRRSASKQSISTLDESHTSSEVSGSTAPTEAYDATDAASVRSVRSKHQGGNRTTSVSTGHGMSREERAMHEQIEDLLSALGESQRELAGLNGLLQVEREERGDDWKVVGALVARLRGEDSEADERKRKRATLPAKRRASFEGKKRPRSVHGESRVPAQQKAEVDELLARVSERQDRTRSRFSASLETKTQLRAQLAVARSQLARLAVTEEGWTIASSEAEDLRSEVTELRTRVNEEFKARQKLEHTIRELKAQARGAERKSAERERERAPLVRAETMDRRASVVAAPANVGLRELRLQRRESMGPGISLRRRLPLLETTALQREGATTTFGTASPTLAPATDASTPFAETSDPFFTNTTATPTVSTPATTPGHSLGPAGASFAPRGSSLATQDLFATPEHSAVPEEALLLELVNAKTAEAQARQEVDEIKRAMSVQARKTGEALARLEREKVGLEREMGVKLEGVRMEAERRVEEARRNRNDEGEGWSMSVPTTPMSAGLEDGGADGSLLAAALTPVPERGASLRARADDGSAGSSPSEPKRTPSPSPGGWGWGWSRRTPSINKTPSVVATPPE